MARRSRKRKLEGEDEPGVKWELTNIFSEELRDEMATMWEIPQIFHFLHISKEALSISHLSMYEMERMLAMPRASKQLAHIMTCLLSPTLPKAKMRKIPPMPYEFWVNVLTHKIKGWFKVYHSKHEDVVKVLEAIGVEPGFWTIFPDTSIIDQKEFDQFTFKERVWILKTLCDTLMHSRKTVQDEMSKQFTDNQFETILGTDRHGAKYFYFPLFLENDLRVYRHSTDNTILSTVKPPSRKDGQTPLPRVEKHTRVKRKRSRWKNGSLPVQNKRRSKRLLDEESKLNGDIANGSLLGEDTNMSGISSCSNNNNVAIETIDRRLSRSSSKTPELKNSVVPTFGEIQCGNPKSSGYETNTSSDAKSLNGGETDELFRGFDRETDRENFTDVLWTVRDVINGITSKVSDLIKIERSPVVRNPLKFENHVNGQKYGVEDDDSTAIDEKSFESDHEGFPADSGSDDLNWTKRSFEKSRNFDETAVGRENAIFSSMLGDLSVSNFELVADSVDTLRELAASLLSNELNETRSRTSYVPKCEFILARSMEQLVATLKDAESGLKESTKKARSKLQREWTQFKDGVVEDQDASGDVDHGSNRWIVGSQGCPLLSSSDATLQTLSESALSPPSPEIPTKRSPSAEFEPQDADERATGDSTAEPTENGKANEKRRSTRRGQIETGKEGDESKNEPETRRVLRRRGISSYTEQLSSSEEEAYELEEWSRFAALYETPGPSDGPPVVQSPPKTGQIGDEPATKDSDQDWLLPSSRKRKNKRSPGTRKLKPSGQKSTSNNSDSQEATSNNPPTPTHDRTNTPEPAKDIENTENTPVICKVESVHSVLDIKDESPIFEYNRNIPNPNDSDPLNSTSQQYPVVPPQLPPPPRIPQAPQIHQMPTSYYVQGPEHYFPSGPPTVPPFVQYPFPQTGDDITRYSYPRGPSPGQYPVPTNQQNYWHYQQQYGHPPAPTYSTNVLRPGYPIQRNVPPQRHQGSSSSTTLYGARSPNKPPMPRMIGSRPIQTVQTVQTPNFRGTTRSRYPAVQTPVRRYGPRNSTPQTASGTPVPRPGRPKTKRETNASVTKTTSLILLSDSDDEIEMIVTEKKNDAATAGVAAAVATPQRHSNVGGNQNKTVAPVSRVRTKPVVTSEITVPKSREVLSPQMIQRMSQGGISITPVKPPPSKQIPGDPSQGTKLVVVNNETGSHYALSLPNGSKLILTPDQVAQIRASNGGKLVL